MHLIMPYYILSTISCIKNNEYKFGYSTKNKYELLRQYEKNKRLITNPFIVQWWDNKGSIKEEKIIHGKLKKDINIENISGEWYNCDNLLYFLTIINKEIIEFKNNKEKYIYDIEKEIVLLSNIDFNTEKNIIQENFINILNKDYKQKILINYNILFFCNLNSFNYKFNEVIIDDVKYLHYKNFIDFLFINMKDKKSKYLIIDKINNDIKKFIYNMDNYYLKLINESEVFFLADCKLPVIEKDDIIDIELTSIYIDKKDFFYSSKEYIIKNQKNIFKNVYEDIYFIDQIKIINIIIKIKIEKTFSYYTIDEYINKIKIILSFKKPIKVYKRIYYSFNIVSLNKYLDTEKYYNLLDLENRNLFNQILNENLYEDINIYIKNKIISIKKYTFYQIINKNKKKEEKYNHDLSLTEDIKCYYKYCSNTIHYGDRYHCLYHIQKLEKMVQT